MKNKFNCLFLLLILTCTSCFMDVVTIDASIKKDCTGSYLHVEGKDFKVCNPESLEPIGKLQVKARYRYLETCSEYGLCFANHDFESWIEVLEVF